LDQITRDIINWDIVNWSQSLRFWEEQADFPDKTLKCLELGSKNGGLSLWLAKKGYRVVCSDIEDPAPGAQPLHKKYDVDNLVTYEVIDATNIPYTNHFDMVIFKSIIGAVGWQGRDDLQRKCLGEIHKCLKPGGQLLFAENLTGTAMHSFFRHRFAKWSKSWNYLRYDMLDSLLADFSNYTIQTTGFLGLLGGNERMREILGSLDKHILNRLIPKKGRYIVFCMAKK
jgi:SAM-dependent methyltransferase